MSLFDALDLATSENPGTYYLYDICELDDSLDGEHIIVRGYRPEKCGDEVVICDLNGRSVIRTVLKDTTLEWEEQWRWRAPPSQVLVAGYWNQSDKVLTNAQVLQCSVRDLFYGPAGALTMEDNWRASDVEYALDLDDDDLEQHFLITGVITQGTESCTGHYYDVPLKGTNSVVSVPYSYIDELTERDPCYIEPCNRSMCWNCTGEEQVTFYGIYWKPSRNQKARFTNVRLFGI